MAKDRENHSFKVNGIKNLMKTDYNVPHSSLDVEAEVDDKLSMKENWKKVKGRVLLLSPKREFIGKRDKKGLKELEKYYEKMNKDMEKNNYSDAPYCTECGEPMEMCVDSRTGKLSKYQWKHTCKCIPKDVRLMMV